MPKKPLKNTEISPIPLNSLPYKEQCELLQQAEQFERHNAAISLSFLNLTAKEIDTLTYILYRQHGGGTSNHNVNNWANTQQLIDSMNIWRITAKWLANTIAQTKNNAVDNPTNYFLQCLAGEFPYAYKKYLKWSKLYG